MRRMGHRASLAVPAPRMPPGGLTLSSAGHLTEAARKALAMHHGPNSIVTVFEMFSAGQTGPERVDLQKVDVSICVLSRELK